MPPAARLTDMHICRMQTPGVPSIAHVGGPITGPGVPNVLIEKIPAAVLGDMCVCVGPPDTIVKGSTTVMIGGKPAARMGDTTAHGGTIVLYLNQSGLGNSDLISNCLTALKSLAETKVSPAFFALPASPSYAP